MNASTRAPSESFAYRSVLRTSRWRSIRCTISIDMPELRQPGLAQLVTRAGDHGTFVEAVRTREALSEDGRRGISGAEAAAALRTALRVIDSMPPLEGLD